MQPVKTEIACSLSRQSILMVITKHHSALMGISLIQMVYLTFKVKLKSRSEVSAVYVSFFSGFSVQPVDRTFSETLLI